MYIKAINNTFAQNAACKMLAKFRLGRLNACPMKVS